MAESVIKSYFPSQVVSDAEKLSYDYGLKVAKAIETEWFYDDRRHTRYEANFNDFHQLRLYARGEQSVQKYKDELSINGDLSYLNLDWTPVPNRQKPKLNIKMSTYNNKGYTSTIIK